jgi:hypothetical protein
MCFRYLQVSHIANVCKTSKLKMAVGYNPPLSTVYRFDQSTTIWSPAIR